ncbi:AdoMet-dependent rRNA methyltransferase spb1 [Orbilia brochopaga]|uniref:AdoMet-dependent rRNA methyltransferase spb1 n=1 Tax=Orbilia brochopaga TaxID=3140254 RepID=A0AAV9UZQ7_9PEZI
MGIQKKHGKGRLDKWYKLAKEKNYRARSAFKLIQLNQKYGFLQKSRVLIDLCAAPGGWLQVAAENMPNSSLIVGVDLAPIKPIPKVITFVADITTDKCRSTLRQHLKTWKADTVLHDGAPNVGTAWVQDAFTQAELALQSLKLATEFLTEGGTFVTKIFRSKDYNSLLWVFNQLFKKVEATKPPSSRNVSAEIFVVCRGYLAPKRVDPKFLDPKTVFEELPDPTPNNEAKVYNPEKKKRKREGYEEGDHLQYKEAPVKEFIETTDPIALLGSLNKFTFTDKNDIATAAITRMPETTQEIRRCCDDLRVLGRRDFKQLLKWRLAIRDKFGWSAKKKKEEEESKAEAERAEEAEITPMDEELRIEEDLKNMRDKEIQKKKKEKRRENERKQKEIVRLQMHMTAPMDIGLEQHAGPGDEQSMFKLKAIDAAGGLKEVAKGKMNMIVNEEAAKARAAAAVQDEDNEGDESEDSQDELEDELDRMYEQFVQRKAERDDKFKAKKARKENADDEWEGIDEDKTEVTSDEEVVAEDDDDDDDSSEDDEESDPKERLVTSLENDTRSSGGLSKKAALFFDQDIFKEFGDIEEEGASTDEDNSSVDLEMDDAERDKEEEEDELSDQDDSSATIEEADEWYDTRETASDDDDVSDSGIEIVPSNKDDNWDANEKEPTKNGKPDIDIITAEAMTLAQQIALGKKSKADLIDDGFNKYSFRSKDGLPEWFLEDEAKHSRPIRPVTAAGAAAIKEKLRALNARPIKKVKEAKDRKKFKAHQRLEKLRKKSAMLMEDEGMTEKEKAQQITRMINRATKKKPKQAVKVVVAKGGNKGVQGRPRGVKGKYKIVDARMKKDKSRAKKK